MSLGDKLRHAEEYGAKAAHLGAEQVRRGLRNVDAKLHKVAARRTSNRTKPASAHADPVEQPAPNPKVRTGIVSIHGRDVEEMRCTGGRKLD